MARNKLACFFKQPLDSDQHDLHEQFNDMVGYLRAAGVEGA